MKIGRNDPCPCFSGKKYKNCCLGLSEVEILEKRLHNLDNEWWSYERINEKSTEEIIEFLQAMNIPFTEEKFQEEIRQYPSAQDVSESWFDSYDVQFEGLDEDFPFFAAHVLWDRLAPSHTPPLETIHGWIHAGETAEADGDYPEAILNWQRAWDTLKKIITPEMKKLEDLEEFTRDHVYVREFLESFTNTLLDEGIRNPRYYEQATKICKEVLALFPEEDAEFSSSIRRTLARAYHLSGQHAFANTEFRSLVTDYPQDPWVYIDWGDSYVTQKPYNKRKARSLYREGLENVPVEDYDREVLEERLEWLDRL